jgi:hypothetical protein
MLSVCEVTHRLILVGSCPRCGGFCRDGQLMADRAQQVSAMREWNRGAILEILTSGNIGDQIDCIHNLCKEEGSPVDLLDAFELASKSKDRFLRDDTATGLLVVRGPNLNVEDVGALEELCVARQDSLAARTLLLGYYAHRHFATKEYQAAALGHVLWIVANAPASAVAGDAVMDFTLSLADAARDRAQLLWLQQLEKFPESADVLANAASFFADRDPDLCIRLLKEAQALDPVDSPWATRLAAALARRVKALSAPERTSAGQIALADIEKLYRASADIDKLQILETVADLALWIGDIPKTEHYASELLDQATRPALHGGDSEIHKAHTLLGVVALTRGDQEGAKGHLLSSGRSGKSCTLYSFGPSMMLANALLDLGETEVVVEYLRLCAKFWVGGAVDHSLERWIYQIEQGVRPDFGWLANK